MTGAGHSRSQLRGNTRGGTERLDQLAEGEDAGVVLPAFLLVGAACLGATATPYAQKCRESSPHPGHMVRALPVGSVGEPAFPARGMK